MAVVRLKTTCNRDCPNTCGLLASVRDGRLISLVGDPEAPVNRGRCCVKCSRYLDRVYDPRRIVHPMRRRGDGWVRVSWDEALDEMERRIKEAAADDPATILYYQGFGGRTALKLVNRRFFNLLGDTTVTKGTICGGAGQGSQDLDFGERISHDVRDHLNSGAMILWGRNPVATSLNLVPVMKALRERGRPVVLIDPVATRSAYLCSRHVAPRPGTDSFLALALARIVLERGGADLDFLQNRCEGLGDYLRVVESGTLSERSRLCDVPEAGIGELAEILMDNPPVSFVLGWGLHRWERSDVTLRSIDALGAVCGSIGVSGGGVSQGFEEYLPYDWDVWGDELRPNRRRFFMQLLGEELDRADPPIRFALFTAGNPAAMLPDSNRVAAAIGRIPFKAYAGHFLDDTAELCDLFLPSTTFLEERDVVASYGHSWIGPLNKAIEPVGEARSDFGLFMDLGSRFPFAGDYVKSLDSWLETIMAPTLAMGVTLEEIFAGGAWQRNVPHVPYLDRVFPTPSGKFRLLGRFDPPAGRDREHPYQLMSVAPREWLCSEVLESEHPDVLTVTISSAEAAGLGLSDGDLAEVFNHRGTLRCLVRTHPALRRDLVVIPRGGRGRRGCNVNVLTGAVVTAVGQGTAYYETRVSVGRIGR